MRLLGVILLYMLAAIAFVGDPALGVRGRDGLRICHERIRLRCRFV